MRWKKCERKLDEAEATNTASRLQQGGIGTHTHTHKTPMHGDAPSRGERAGAGVAAWLDEHECGRVLRRLRLEASAFDRHGLGHRETELCRARTEVWLGKLGNLTALKGCAVID